MDNTGVPPQRSSFRAVVFIPLLFLVCGIVGYRRYKDQQLADSAKNFEVHYTLPTGWKAASHGPSTLFREVDPKTGVCVRGAANQVIDPNNPTPELDTAGIARYFEDRTQENMPDWEAKALGSAEGDGFDFAVLRRSKKDRIVVTAYAVKGNTTLLFSLFGQGKSKNSVDSSMPTFYRMLKTVSLHEKDMSNL